MTYNIQIHASGLDAETIAQIYKITSIPDAFEDNIAIMPDAHAGAGCCIGFTGKVKDYICPNFVGVDVGCGVQGVNIGDIDIDYAELDKFLKATIPLGMTHRTEAVSLSRYEMKVLLKAIDVQEAIKKTKYSAGKQLGTLGGGNHFIEIGEDSNKDKWIFIHSGSRNFGLTVAKHHQAIAEKQKIIPTPKGMEVLAVNEEGQDYLKDMQIAQEFAMINRTIMTRLILIYLDTSIKDCIDSVHNFIDSEGYVRKGAISAHTREEVLIPLNMRDGTVIGLGKGNQDYNYSAPHGAGRMFGRSQMKRKLSSGEVSIEAFKKEMEGIYTTTANGNTIDESPFAYKPFEMIQEYLEETIEIKTLVKPKYNLKGSD